MLVIYIDGDGCPVKDEVYRVARRYKLSVQVVSNHFQRVPADPAFAWVPVESGTGKADDYIAEHIEDCDLVVTADIPLAARCLERGAAAIGPKGREFTKDSIGEALAGRLLSDHLRQLGIMNGGPAPMAQKDRSRFLSVLDNMANAMLRKAKSKAI